MTEIKTETCIILLNSPPESTGQLEGSKSLIKRVKRPKKRLVYVDWIRFVAIVMVVVVHAGQDVPKPSGMPEYLNERRLGFLKMLCQFGVTTFFYCGGKVQALKQVGYSKFLSSRFRRVILPLVVAIPLVLQPAQFLACSNGIHSAHCQFIWPVQSEPVTYLVFLQHWVSLGVYSFSKMHWLWFLPTIFLTDALNFAPTRWMSFYFQGGWINVNSDSKDNVPRYETFYEEFADAILKRPDAAGASFVLVFYYTGVSIFIPRMLIYFLAYWTAMILVFVGLVCLRKTKRYEVWWVTSKILPALSMLFALYWIQEEGGSTAILNITMFTLFGAQGYLEQVVDPFLEMNCNRGGKTLRPSNFILTIFLIAICAPTSGADEEYYKVPMFRKEPWLAVLATVGNWIAVWLLDRFSYAYMNEEFSHFQYFHFTQCAMIIYVFHMLFLVVAIVFISPLLPGSVGYVVRFSIDIAVVLSLCGALYALLLQYHTTRFIFGLRRDMAEKKCLVGDSVQDVV